MMHLRGMHVRPKKALGQHFLKNDAICARIADSITGHGGYDQLLEIGPGTGALTKHLLQKATFTTTVIEIDHESVAWLKVHFPQLPGRILEEDFLRMQISDRFERPFGLVGNFPYNISSQIVIKMLEYKDMVPEMVGMFQKEVAVRLASPPGSRDYGILSVFCQAFYDLDYLFTVDEHEFDPAPKVKSGVIRMRRKFGVELGCDEKLFRIVVKTAFNQRRKTLRNSLKSLVQGQFSTEDALYDLRPERLGVEEFVQITLRLQEVKGEQH
jgi:16S rRNA (adenine1518-N6/adenine1519-N6)-dimethyltransferase